MLNVIKSSVTSNSLHVLTARLLPKKIFREPFGLLTLKVSSPSHFFKSPELINSSWDQIFEKVRMNQVRGPFGLLVQKFGRLRSQIRRLRRPGDRQAAALYSTKQKKVTILTMRHHCIACIAMFKNLQVKWLDQGETKMKR